jgi:hypothetical protein
VVPHHTTTPKAYIRNLKFGFDGREAVEVRERSEKGV